MLAVRSEKYCAIVVMFSFVNDILVVRAVKDIAVGDEIFNCYGQQPAFVSVTEYCTAYFWFSHGSYCNIYIYIFIEGMCSRQWTAL